MSRYNRALDTLSFVKQANRTPPAMLETWVTNERARLNREGASRSEREIDRLHLAEKCLGNAHTELARDPLGWSIKTGRQDVPPLDLTNGETLGASLKRRQGVVAETARFYSRPQKWFRPEEREMLTAAAREGGRQSQRPPSVRRWSRTSIWTPMPRSRACARRSTRRPRLYNPII